MTWAVFHNEAHYQAVGEILLSGSDRVTAIVGGSLLDEALHRTLSERFRDDKDTTKKLLKANGPLGNTGPKIDVLYQLYAFEKPVRNAMYGLSGVRNYFAHNLSTSFDSNAQEMVDRMKFLVLHEGLTVYPHRIYDGNTKEPIEDVDTNRDKFIVNLKLCLIALMRNRVRHETFSNNLLTKKAMLKLERHFKRVEREASSKKVIVVPSP